jgi:hypothetical protein
MQYTLHELLMTHKVIVPQIQRDYAQGRATEKEMRKGFVGKLKEALFNNTPLNLDFVYGYTKKASADITAFIPLDGQQRITTLWLLHWFVAPRSNQQVHGEYVSTITTKAQQYLHSFTYETRISSKRFCHALTINTLPSDSSNQLSSIIRDSPWFMASWSSDPTISAMLNMLDTIQEENFDKQQSWQRLVEERTITFDYIDIKADEFRLTDELYIKMNSRGKPLTSFENFKAQFSGLLSSKETEYSADERAYQGTFISYQQYFAFNVDGKWMDLFWTYRRLAAQKIDDSFLNFIYYIGEFLYYKNSGDTEVPAPKREFAFLNTVFSVKQNVDFLFDAFDFLSSLKELPKFFDSVFEKLSPFDSFSKDYFLRAIQNKGFEVKDRVIFYALLSYCNATKTATTCDKLKDFLRVVRNLLQAVRQPNQNKRIEYTTNLRLPNAANYCLFIDELIRQTVAAPAQSVYEVLAEHEFRGFNSEIIAVEKIKAMAIHAHPELKEAIFLLEEHTAIQGNTVNFQFDGADTKKKIAAFLAIWSSKVSNSLIIRSFLTIGDYSVETHDYSFLGSIWYFGSDQNWNRILTATGREERKVVATTLDRFLAAYQRISGSSPTERLQNMVENFQPVAHDWRYYFIKYPTLSANSFFPLNVFTWKDENGFHINSLGNSGKAPLHSYHLNPYEFLIYDHFKALNKVRLNWGRFGEESFLSVVNMVFIESRPEGWQIIPTEKYQLPPELVTEYCLDQRNHSYVLKEMNGKDRIETVIDFVNSLLAERK